MGDLTTGFLSLRREGLSRSSLWSPTRSPERAQPWIVAALAGLERWSWDLLLLMLFMLLNSITKGKKSERKEKKKKKRLTIEERERESVCFGLCEFFFQLNIRLWVFGVPRSSANLPSFFLLSSFLFFSVYSLI